MSDVNLDEALSLARDAAKVSGSILVNEFEKAFGPNGDPLTIKTKSSDIDFVTQVDGMAQKAIIEKIQEIHPDHRFIAEEEGADSLGDKDSPYEWIIDPLDGTLNFIHGKENFGTIIALQKNGEVLVGVMWLPLVDRLFTAIKGKGAFYNGKAVQLRNTQGMTDAVLCSNVSHRAKLMEDGTRYVTIPYCASVENYGSAVDELGRMLMGQTDGAFFDGPRLWDLAAGCLMIEEAGGKAHYELEDPEDSRSGLLCAAATTPIYDELHQFVFIERKA